jgi:hypothetical protein
MHLSLMENIPVILRGYSDPPGFKASGKGGQRYDNLNPFEHVQRYRLALESMVRMLTPNHRYPVIGDTHYGQGLSAYYAELLTDWYGPRYAGLLETAQHASLAAKGGERALWYREPDIRVKAQTPLPLHTEWFPGWQVGVLRAGNPAGDTALYLNGYEYHGHRHYDTLGLILYAFGKEMASDRGYIWDDPRNAWTRSTAAHNLVTVDNANQGRKGRTSVLELFGTGPEVEMIRVRGEHVYSQCSLYRRTCLVIGRAGGPLYVVDVFEVEGGHFHQYGLVCNGALTAPAGAALSPLERKHKWLTNFRCVKNGFSGSFTWKNDDAFLDLLLLTPVDRLVVADAPGWRSDRGSELHAPPVQQVFAERGDPAAKKGAPPLRSRFAALLVPRTGTSFVRKAAFQRGDANTGSWWIRVEHQNGIDFIVAAPGKTATTLGPVRTNAQLAVVRVNADGVVESMTMLAGTELAYGDAQLHLPAAETDFVIRKATGRELTVDPEAFREINPDGAYMLTGGTGFEVKSHKADTLIVRTYPVPNAGRAKLLHAVSFKRMR